MKFYVTQYTRGYAVEAKYKYAKGKIDLDHFEWSIFEDKAQLYDTEDDWGKSVLAFLRQEARSPLGAGYSILTESEPIYEVTYFGNWIDGSSVLISADGDGKPSISFRLTKDKGKAWTLGDKSILKPFAKVEGLAVKETKPLLTLPLAEFLRRCR